MRIPFSRMFRRAVNRILHLRLYKAAVILLCVVFVYILLLNTMWSPRTIIGEVREQDSVGYRPKVWNSVPLLVCLFRFLFLSFAHWPLKQWAYQWANTLFDIYILTPFRWKTLRHNPLTLPPITPILTTLLSTTSYSLLPTLPIYSPWHLIYP